MTTSSGSQTCSRSRIKLRSSCTAVERRLDSDIAARFALERLLEILGEAANSVGAATCERFSDVPWRDVSRLRIVLAHHYHRVDPEQVWSMATEEVPALAAALRRGSSAAGDMSVNG